MILRVWKRHSKPHSDVKMEWSMEMKGTNISSIEEINNGEDEQFEIQIINKKSTRT